MRSLAGLLALLSLAAFAGPARADAEVPDPPLVMAPPEPSQPPARKVGVLLGLVGAPNPLGAELFVRANDFLGFGAGVGFLPGPLGDVVLGLAGVSGASLSAWSAEGEMRVFPFRGAFWLGGAFGRMSASASGTSHGFPVNIDANALYLAPRAGWLATWRSGFVLGFDVGLQVPVSTDVQVTSTSPQQSNLESVARALAGLPLPTAQLRLGWML